jgi:hypothetical protein
MKNIKQILVFSIFLFGITDSYAQDKIPQTVIIKTFEIFGGKGSQMVVTSPDGTSKAVELKRVDPGNYLIGTNDNNAIVQSEINEWKRQGFTIDGLSTIASTGLLLTTIILSKDE